ncbi:hypothetical protein CC85DRAFT_283549 [Cutaneotrichosporon oleaginosum]|uniref:Uncharacterized protein n=1 Tax=Cutaneotrichosporon oleaginosum TaxID=879819 RepID=A0A0J0XU42_9TREE|nr:uncharacterized protein CC85DRAFT_283549 [Cutaneotrichosporon oleaginosum]KLT44616.1 hypothetical protein CC85DRAFT_283549 [Cutaneotrichosporon oleaginosum]TXT13869.1 hypothetical protein COLE_00062 [Cutaneotrichosporon oleaginosum]
MNDLSRLGGVDPCSLHLIMSFLAHTGCPELRTSADRRRRSGPSKSRLVAAFPLRM